jgi:hypothetical protein
MGHFKTTKIMKKLLTGLAIIAFTACNNDGKVEKGVVNDGIKPVDKNGGLSDTANAQYNPSIDTTLGEDRTDLERRDTSTLRR